jgi:hypothetical protein
MSFFELPPEPQEPPQPTPIQPPWLGPPDNVVGASVPLEPLLLVRTDKLAVSLGGLVAYPSGLEFTLIVRQRVVDEDDDWIHAQMRLRHGRRGREVPPELLRFGVEFADGRKATNLGGWRARFEPHERPPDQPILVEHGGGGGGTRFDQDYWLWPLPPPGRLTFACEWPSEGVALTRVDVDTTAILDASTRSTTLWEPAPDAGGGHARGSAQFLIAHERDDDAST